MFEAATVEPLVSLGVGGVLGVIIFLMYRKDRQSSEGKWREQNKDMLRCREEENRTRNEHIKILSELTILIRKLNGKRD